VAEAQENRRAAEAREARVSVGWVGSGRGEWGLGNLGFGNWGSWTGGRAGWAGPAEASPHKRILKSDTIAVPGG